jgi:transmembrane sensor
MKTTSVPGNRYRRGTIRILDKRLLSLRVSGIFYIRNPDGVLDAIIGTLPVRATELTPYLILLRPA